MARAETIRSPSTGLTRRTTIGKRWAVIVQQDEAERCEMLTFATEDKARECCRAIGNTFAPLVHYVERVEVVAFACDCQNPDGIGVRHVSMECPVHNDNPYPHP